MTEFLSRQMRRAAERRAAKDARMATKKQPSLVPTSRRWVGRTKGLPFSRMVLVSVLPMGPKRPNILWLEHPTRGTQRLKQATPELLAVFLPRLPDNLRADMLGH